MGLTPGSRLGAYEITGAIGAGGMGEVYRAKDSRLKREVALKVAPIAVNGGTLSPGTPRRLLDRAYFPGFTTRGSNIRGYDVSPDGQRFLMIKSDEEGSTSRSMLTIAVNWRPQS